MNKGILLLMVCCLFFFCGNAQSYRADFNNALEKKNMTKMEEILKAWDFADSNDPDLYIAYFNFYTLKSQQVSMLSATGYDRNFSKQALGFITEGIIRFPTRFDMRIAKIHMLGVLRDYPAYVDEVIAMIRYSVEIQNNWKREEYLILDKPDAMFYDAVLEYQGFLFSKNDPALHKEIIRISEEMLKFYPKHVQSLLSMSTVYDRQKEVDKSLTVLTKALAIEPANAVVMYRLALVYYQKSDRANVKKYLELAVKNCKEDETELKEKALKRLAELK